MKLMIVDDSMVIRRKIERANQLPVEKVVQAENGHEAVAVCRRELPDVVTMDLTMPHMDGVECVKRLVEIKPDIRVLVISALADKHTAIQAIKNGARGFLCKPFSEDALNSALQKLLTGN